MSNWKPSLAFGLDLALMAISLAAVAMFLRVAFSRINYPYALEWMEGGSAAHVRWLLAGHPLYGPPNLHFVPYQYGPLFYFVSAAVSRVFGISGFLPLRGVSLVSTLGTFVILYEWARRETGTRLAGIAGVGLFAASFGEGGYWFDLARVDSLFVFLLLAGLFIHCQGLGHPKRVHGMLPWLSSGFLVLAVLTKQTALPVTLALLAYPLLRRNFSGPIRDLSRFMGLGAVVYLLLQRSSGGWFYFYCFGIRAQFEGMAGMRAFWWPNEIFPRFLPLFLIILAFLAQVTREKPLRAQRDHGLWLAMFLMTTLGSALYLRFCWSYKNVLLPAHAALALVGAVAFGTLRDRVSGPARHWAPALVVFLQIFVLVREEWPDIRGQIPKAILRQAGDRVVREIASLPGRVYIPTHGYLTQLAGKPEYVDLLAIKDLYLYGNDHPVVLKFRADMKSAFERGEFQWALLDSEGQLNLFEADLSRHLGDTQSYSTEFRPLTGEDSRPSLLSRILTHPPVLPRGTLDPGFDPSLDGACPSQDRYRMRNCFPGSPRWYCPADGLRSLLEPEQSSHRSASISGARTA